MTEGYGWDALIKTANDAGFFILPIDTYACRITNVDVRKSSTGKDQLKVRWEVMTGPNAGKPIMDTMTISPENATAVAIFFRQMDAIGLTEDFFKGGQTGLKPTLHQVATAMVGRTANLKIGHREWQGRQQMDVQAVTALQMNVPTPAVGGPPVTGVPTPPVPTAPPQPAPQPAPAVSVPSAPVAPTPAPQPAPYVAPEQPIPPAPIQPTIPDPTPPPAAPAPPPPAAPASAPAPAPVPASMPSPAPAPVSTETPAPSPAVVPSGPGQAEPLTEHRPAPPAAPF